MKKYFLSLAYLLTLTFGHSLAHGFVFYRVPSPAQAPCLEAANGGYVCKLDSAVIVAPYAANADGQSPTGNSVARSGLLNTGELRIDGTVSADTYHAWVLYRGESGSGGWIDTSALGPFPLNNAVGFALSDSAAFTWAPIGLAGSNTNFAEGANEVGQREFELGTSVSLFLKGLRDTVFACVFLHTDPQALPPEDCEDESEPAPTAHYTILKCSSCPSAVDSSQWAEANAWNIVGNNATGETGHEFRVLHDGTFFYALIYAPDANIVAPTTANDDLAIFSGNDRIEISLRSNLSTVPRDETAVKVAVNANASGAIYGANYPGGVVDVSYDPSITRTCDFPSGAWRCFIKWRFADETLTDGSHILMDFLVANAGSGSLFGFGNAINNPTTWATVAISADEISGVDDTPPTVGDPDCNNSVTTTSFVCLFTTNEAGQPSLIYGTSTGVYPSTFSGGSCVGGNCSVSLTGLTPGTTYFVKSRVTDAAGNTGVSDNEDSQATASATTCHRYASSNGNGNGMSEGTPYLISNFWPQVSGSVRILCLLDGVYTGTNSMIVPPGNLSGASGNPIIVRALNDGGARIDGQGARRPIHLANNNDWFIIEGMNANDAGGGGVNGVAAVVGIDSGSDNNFVRRVVGWDCQLDGNCSLFGIHGGVNNVFEDVAGFGRARKMFSMSQSGYSNATFRRAWAAWSRNTRPGSSPKMAFTIVYSNYNGLCENCIGTWREEGTDTPLTDRYGMFATDHIRNVPDQCPQARYLGSIAYRRSSDPLRANYLGQIRNRINCLTYEHVVAYDEESNARSAHLINGNPAPSGEGPNIPGSKVVNLNTWIGGAAPTIQNEWTVTNTVDVNTVGAAPNVWNGAGNQGARVCKRYLNGTLTNDPLWPWPMDSRINAALTASGRNPANYFRGTGNTVTSEMETIFGTIPSECKN